MFIEIYKLKNYFFLIILCSSFSFANDVLNDSNLSVARLMIDGRINFLREKHLNLDKYVIENKENILLIYEKHLSVQVEEMAALRESKRITKETIEYFIEYYQRVYDLIGTVNGIKEIPVVFAHLNTILEFQSDKKNAENDNYMRKIRRIFNVDEKKIIENIKQSIIKLYKPHERKELEKWISAVNKFLYIDYSFIPGKAVDVTLGIKIRDEIEEEFKSYVALRRKAIQHGIPSYTERVVLAKTKFEMLEEAILSQCESLSFIERSHAAAVEFIIDCIECLEEIENENLRIEREIEIKKLNNLKEKPTKRRIKKPSNCPQEQKNELSVYHNEEKPTPLEEENEFIKNFAVMSQICYDRMSCEITKNAEKIVSSAGLDMQLDRRETPAAEQLLMQSKLYTLVCRVVGGERVKHDDFIRSLRNFANDASAFGTSIHEGAGSRIKLVGPHSTSGIHLRHGGRDGSNPSISSSTPLFSKVIEWLGQWSTPNYAAPLKSAAGTQ